MVFLLGVLGLGLVGAALSLRALPVWSQRQGGNVQAVFGFLIGGLLAGLVLYGLLSGYLSGRAK